MNNNYGQIFLLLLAIVLILMGASGKTKQILDVIRGTGSTAVTPNGGKTSTNGSQVPDMTTPGNAADKAGSGHGGVLG